MLLILFTLFFPNMYNFFVFCGTSQWGQVLFFDPIDFHFMNKNILQSLLLCSTESHTA